MKRALPGLADQRCGAKHLGDRENCAGFYTKSIMHHNRWLLPGAAAIALAGCYASAIAGMVNQWSSDEDMGHGFVVPVVIAWIVLRERARWPTLAVEPTAWGLALLLAAAALDLAGSAGAGLFARSLALLLSIAGAILCLGGLRWLRAWAFPLLLALFMLPKLAIVYNQATLPLQLLASRMAAGMLATAGAAVIRDGNILDVGGHRILVAEACSGIRYLLPLGFTALLIGYLFDSRSWMRLLLLAAAIPIAIFANATRVAVAGAIPALAEGTPHALSGVLIFALCLAALIASLTIAQRLFPGSLRRRHA
jgi:exosortase